MNDTDMQSNDTADMDSALESASVETTASEPAQSASPPQTSQPSRSWEAAMEAKGNEIADRELPSINAPPNWKEGLDWQSLPRSVQQHIIDREGDYHRGMTQYGTDVKLAREMGQVINDFNSRLPAFYHQITPQEQVRALYQANEMLMQHPVEAIQFLAQQHGVDLGMFGPNGQAMQQMQAQHQQWHQQRQQYFQKEFENFIRERADYWSAELEDEVLRQIDAVKATNPSLFQIDPFTVVRQAEERAKKVCGISDKQAAVEARKKADEAKRLASLNVKSSTGRSPSNTSRGMFDTDTWTAAYDKANRR